MNRIVTLILLIGCLLLPAQLYAAANSYYVTQNGKGARNGESLDNAWSVSDFNSSAKWSPTDHPNKIDPGDTIFFSGTITSQIYPPTGYGGTAGNAITLDGWEAGSCDPLADRSCAAAANVDICTTNSNSCWGIRILGGSHITIQDFELTGSWGGVLAAPDSDEAESNLIIRRLYVHDQEGAGIKVTSYWKTPWWRWSWVTIGGADGDGNLVYNTNEFARGNPGEHSSNLYALGDDLIVSYNEIGNDFRDDSSGNNNVEIHQGDNQLIEFNTFYFSDGQAGISVKESGGTGKIVRFNKGWNVGTGISISSHNAANQDVYVYGNLVFDSEYGVRAYKTYDNIHFFNNVLQNLQSRGVWIGKLRDYQQGDVYVYNNTISRVGDGSLWTSEGGNTGIIVHGASPLNVRIKNNILMNNDSYGTYDQIFVAASGESLISDWNYNTLYSTGSTAKVYYESAHRSVSYLQGRGIETHGYIKDPGFIDPKGGDGIHGTEDDDYTLDGTSVENGEDLSACFAVIVQGSRVSFCYDDGIDPNHTDWTTTPPTVVTAKQDNHGKNWERGAYVYVEGAKNSAIRPPTSVRILYSN